MKLGFVFDTRFIKFNEDYYSTNLSVELLSQRYLKDFDDMVVVGRYKEVTEDPTGKYLKCNNEKIKFEGILDEKPLKRIEHFIRDTLFIEKVLKDCDAVICRGWRGTLICKKLNKPYLVEVVNCAWDSYWNHSLWGKIVAPIMFAIRKYTTKTAPYVMYVTNQFLQRRYPTKGKSVAVSDVALEPFDDNVLEKRIERIESKKPNDKIIIGTAGAVDVAFKGHRFVISAISDLKKQGIGNIEYQIVGKGNNQALMELAKQKNVSDQIVFLGSVVHEKMFKWYDDIDIYIQPSLQEGLPRALIEAMSRGLTCYGTQTGGIPELLDKDYVCKSNYFISSQITKFLKEYDANKGKESAIRNYNEAQKYERQILKKKCEDFYHEFFINSCRGIDENN